MNLSGLSKAELEDALRKSNDQVVLTEFKLLESTNANLLARLNSMQIENSILYLSLQKDVAFESKVMDAVDKELQKRKEPVENKPNKNDSISSQNDGDVMLL